jgi:hypothetical protein
MQLRICMYARRLPPGHMHPFRTCQTMSMSMQPFCSMLSILFGHPRSAHSKPGGREDVKSYSLMLSLPS